MTIRLLGHFNGMDANTIVDLDAATELGLVAAKQATTDLAGGTYWYDKTLVARAVRPERLRDVGPIFGLGGNILLPPTFTAPGAGIRNYALAMSGWAMFNAVQIVFANHQASPVTVDDHVVGASSTAWPNGVFNINNPESGWSVPAGPVTVPAANVNNKRPGFALGPKLAVRSIPRAANEPDGGKHPLLFVRTKHVAGNSTMPMVDLGDNFPSLYDPVNEGYSILTAPPFPDVEATSSNQSSWTTSGARESKPALVAFGAIFTYDKPMTSIMFLGDSIMAGTSDGASNRSPWGFKAVARLRATGRRVAYFNCGIAGSPIESITGRGKDLLALNSPDVVVLAPYTINSGVGTQAAWDSQWSTVMDLIQTHQAAGKHVVLTTPLPNASFSQSQNGYRVRQLRRVLDSGLPVINFESLANSAGTWANAADTSDGIHLSGTGHDKAAMLALPTLDSLVA